MTIEWGAEKKQKNKKIIILKCSRHGNKRKLNDFKTRCHTPALSKQTINNHNTRLIAVESIVYKISHKKLSTFQELWMGSPELETTTSWDLERADVCSFTPASREIAFRIWTRDLQITMQQPYSCTKAHPLFQELYTCIFFQHRYHHIHMNPKES